VPDRALVTRGLSVHYGVHVALRNVDLAVGRGELLALVGRNGAGKSSLLSALAGVCPCHGTVDWSAAPVAYVAQRATPRWEMPLEVRQVVATGCLRGRRWWQRPTPADQRRVAAALERLDLSGLARRPVRTLSGGQAQRVLLARALAQRPRVLLLDEPYGGLDEVSVDVLNTALTDLAATGVAVIAAVHELGVVRRTFQRVVALDGRVVADGSPAEVFSPRGLTRLFGIEAVA